MANSGAGASSQDLDRAEHFSDDTVALKKVGLYQWDETAMAWIKMSATGAVIPAWDYLKVTYPAADTETYTFKAGGSGGVTTAVVTIVYTTTGKTFIDTVTVT